MCKAEGMGICPWGALGGGKFKTEEQRKGGEGRKVEASENEIKVSEALEKIAKRKDTIITSVAMAYVMQKTPYVFPIIGGRKIDHLKGNIEALSIELSSEDIKEIEGAMSFNLGFPHNILWGPEPRATDQSITLLKMGGTYDYVEDYKVSLVISGVY